MKIKKSRKSAPNFPPDARQWVEDVIKAFGSMPCPDLRGDDFLDDEGKDIPGVDADEIENAIYDYESAYYEMQEKVYAIADATGIKVPWR